MSVVLAKSPRSYSNYTALNRLTSIYFENYAVSCISICTIKKNGTFGKSENGKFIDTMEAKIIRKAWQELPVYFPNCTLGNFGITSNMLTGIINIDNRTSQENSRKMMPQILAYFKARTTKLLNQYHGTHGKILWENNFEEKVIENLNDLSEALNKINNHL